MTDLEQLWRSKTDEQVSAAASRLAEYTPDAQAVIRAEFERRKREPSPVFEGPDPTVSYIAGLNLASRGERLTAQILDSLIPLAALIISISVMEASPLPGTIMFYVAFLFAFWYLLFADGFSGGQSWGKKALRIAVVDLSTRRPCRAWKSFLRNAPLLVLGFFDWVFIFGRMHQRLGDMIARTIVIKVRDTERSSSG